MGAESARYQRIKKALVPKGKGQYNPGEVKEPKKGGEVVAMATGSRRVDHEKVRRLRLKKLMTQQELADAAGVGLDTLWRMERGGRASSIRTLKRVASALGIEPQELVL